MKANGTKKRGDEYRDTENSSDSEKPNILGVNLLELRNSHGHNQEKIANDLGISTATYSSWERGRTEPCIKDIKRLASFFGVSVDRLVRNESRPLKIGASIFPWGNFHPIKNPDGIFFMIYSVIFNFLYYYDIHERRFQVGLIDGWSINRIESTYTFYLKKGVKFHTDEIMEPEDVRESFNLFIESNPFYKMFIEEINVKKEENAVELKLYKGKWLELEDLPAPYIIPRSYVRADSDVCFDGTGPYKLTDQTQQERIREGLKQPVRLEINRDYYGKMPSIQFVEYHWIQDVSKLEENLNKGGIDLAYEVNKKLVDESRNEIETGKGTFALYLVLNQSSEICRDQNFRKAVNFAIDRDAVKEKTGIDNAELVPEAHLYLVLRDIKSEDEKNGYNKTEAEIYWERAKSSINIDLEDFAFKIGAVFKEDPLIKGIIEEIVAQLNKIGINAVFESDHKEADALLEPVGFHKIQWIYKNLHSHDNPGDIGIPWEYKNSYVDQLLDNFKGHETYKSLQDVLTAEKIFLPIIRRQISIAYTKDLQADYKVYPTNVPYGPDLAYWEFKS